MQIIINTDGQDINGINAGHHVGQDHQHPAKEIIERLKKTKTREQVVECVWRVFGDMFSAEINADSVDDYRDGQFDVWRKFYR